MARAVISCFCQNLQFRTYFAIKTSIFKLRPLLRFLCLINSFYRRYVCCIHNRSNGSNGSPLFFIISPLFFIISPLFLHYFSLFLVIHPLFHITLTILGLHSHVCKYPWKKYRTIKNKHTNHKSKLLVEISNNKTTNITPKTKSCCKFHMNGKP